MVVQYPYNLQLLTKTESVFNESIGEWAAASESWVFFSKCRDEVNSSGGRITNADGQVYIYGGLVQLPKGTDGIKSGDQIRVTDNLGNIRLQGSVERFTKDQLHSRLWV